MTSYTSTPPRYGRARDPERCRHGLGPGVGETHELGRRHHARDALGYVELALDGERRATADLDGLAGGGVHLGVGMAEDGGAVPQPVVDVFVAVDVPQARPSARER